MFKYALKELNIRELKANDSKVLVTVPKEAKVKVLDMEDEWDKVSYGSFTGYVESDLLSKTKYPWTNVNLRKSNSLSSDKILIVPKKSQVEVVENKGDFSRVFYDDKEGYIYNYYLSDDGNNSKALDYTYFRSDTLRFVNENKIDSNSMYLLATDINRRLTFVFQKKGSEWTQLYKWSCTVGKASTPTIKGIFFVNGRKPGFGTNTYSVKYATRIKGGYYYHSVLYNSRGTSIIDGRLAMALSHGCIRLQTQNAKWIYDNVSDNSKIIIC